MRHCSVVVVSALLLTVGCGSRVGRIETARENKLKPLAPGSLPDPKKTPGDVLEVTVQDICTPGYTKVVRNVPSAVKRRAYELYGRVREEGTCCEVDHLIPLELGGSNRLTNLWPEPYDIVWNARVKDRLEGRLHKLVCAGELPLPEAQKIMSTNWIDGYKRYYKSEPKGER